MEMFQVDAFSDRVFAGNPAAVLLLDEWLQDDIMQAIAQENNLAETAFAKPRTDGSWDLRWFAPAHEVGFCGHATIATAHILLSETKSIAPVVFHTRVGPLQVSKSADGYLLDLPSFPPQPLAMLPDEIAHIFSEPPKYIFRNFENIFADLGSSKAVRAFIPDLAAIALLGSVGLVVTGQETKGQRAHFVSRYFAPGAGIPEDPVTGSIHASLVPYWSQQLKKPRLMAFQASTRGGWIDCELAENRVYLRGSAVTFMQASIFLPDNISDKN